MSKKKDEKSTQEVQMEMLQAINSRLRFVGPATPARDETLLGLMYLQPGTKSGEPKKKEAPQEFLDREVKQAESFRMFPRENIPVWLQQQLDCRKNGSREETFVNIVSTLREKPNENNLRLALMVLNEIGRFSDGGVFITKHITQDLLNEFLVKEEQR